MARHPEFTLQALEKIGAPLVAALEAVPLKAEDAELEMAKRMAQMIGQVVQVSIALSGQIAPPTASERDADALRASVAALAAPIIASFYEQHQKVPEEADINRMVKTLESVLAFSDNFSGSADIAESRLVTMDHKTPLFDKTQTALVTLHELTQIIDVITEFPFGYPEGKLLQEISDKLAEYAKGIATKTNKDDKLSELLIFKALVPIYASCHRAETQRLADASEESRGELSLDPVWKSFETKLSMVDTVLDIDITSSGGTSAGAPAPEAAQQEEPQSPTPEAPAAAGGPMGFFAGGGDQAPTAPPPAAPAQEQAPTAAATPPPAAPDTSAPAGAGGPMSFFSKEDDAPTAAPPTAAEASPPTPPPTQPPATEAPPATPPAEGAPPAGGPMSFFKKPEGGQEGEGTT